MGRRIEVNTGDQFGRWTVIKEVERIKSRRQIKCQCSCGSIKSIELYYLTKGESKSCGCYKKYMTGKTHRKHGLHGHYLYRTWCDIKKRCYNPNAQNYHNYGGRGIWVQDDWLNNPAKFINYILDTLGDRPEGMSLDRINNDLGYIEGNLKWSTDKEQANNKRNSKKKPPIKEV